jgi:hypothetical protein
MAEETASLNGEEDESNQLKLCVLCATDLKDKKLTLVYMDTTTICVCIASRCIYLCAFLPFLSLLFSAAEFSGACC